MSESRIALVIVNYNTWNHLQNCLESIVNSLDRVVVFDNCSSDGSADFLRDRYPEVRITESERNLGYGAAANRAVMTCDADYVVVSNSDVVFEADSLDALGRYLDEHPAVGIAAPRLKNPDGTLQASCFPLPGSWAWIVDNDIACRLLRRIPGSGRWLLRAWCHDRERDVPWMKGAVLAIRKMAFEQVGGFDESFLMYYEETDLCLRMAKRGWKIRFAPVTEVVHVGEASTSKVRIEMKLELFVSSMRFAWRHYGKLHRAILLAVWTAIMMLRAWRDRLRLLVCTDPGIRNDICADLEAWRRAIQWSFGHWKVPQV